MKILKRTTLFIEGPDGIGKTTTIDLLKNKLNLPVLKMMRAKKAFNANNIEEISYVFNKTLEQLKDVGYILDRGPISSLIYSKIYGRKSNLKYILPLIQKINPVIIYLTSSEDKQLERKEKDEVIEDKMRKSIAKQYESFYLQNLLNLSIFRLDTSKLSPIEVVDSIIEHLIKNDYVEY